MKTILKPPLNTTQKSTTVTTNLYELIEAVQNQVGSENDELVVATVMYLLRTGHATFLRQHGSKPLQLTSAIRHSVPSPHSRANSCLATGCILPQCPEARESAGSPGDGSPASRQTLVSPGAPIHYPVQDIAC